MESINVELHENKNVLAFQIKHQSAITKVDYEEQILSRSNIIYANNLPKLSKYDIHNDLNGLLYVQFVYERSECKYEYESPENQKYYPNIKCTYVPVYFNIYVPFIYKVDGSIIIEFSEMFSALNLHIPNNISYSIVIPAQIAYFFLPYNKLPKISFVSNDGAYLIFTTKISMLYVKVPKNINIELTTNKPYILSDKVPYNDVGYQGLIKAIVDKKENYLACLIKCGNLVVYDTLYQNLRVEIPKQNVYFYETTSNL